MSSTSGDTGYVNQFIRVYLQPLYDKFASYPRLRGYLQQLERNIRHHILYIVQGHKIMKTMAERYLFMNILLDTIQLLYDQTDPEKLWEIIHRIPLPTNIPNLNKDVLHVEDSINRWMTGFMTWLININNEVGTTQQSIKKSTTQTIETLIHQPIEPNASSLRARCTVLTKLFSSMSANIPEINSYLEMLDDVSGSLQTVTAHCDRYEILAPACQAFIEQVYAYRVAFLFIPYNCLLQSNRIDFIPSLERERPALQTITPEIIVRTLRSIGSRIMKSRLTIIPSSSTAHPPSGRRISGRQQRTAPLSRTEEGRILQQKRRQWQQNFERLLAEFQELPAQDPEDRHRAPPAQAPPSQRRSATTMMTGGGVPAQPIQPERASQVSQRRSATTMMTGGGALSLEQTQRRPAEPLSIRYYQHKPRAQDMTDMKNINDEKLRERKQYNQRYFYEHPRLLDILSHIVTMGMRYRTVVLVDVQNMTHVYHRHVHAVQKQSTFQQRQGYVHDPGFLKFLSHRCQRLREPILWVMITQKKREISSGTFFHVEETGRIRDRNDMIVVHVGCKTPTTMGGQIDCYRYRPFSKNPMDDLFFLTLEEHFRRTRFQLESNLSQEKRRKIRQLEAHIAKLRQLHNNQQSKDHHPAQDEEEDQDHFLQYKGALQRLETIRQKTQKISFPLVVPMKTDHHTDWRLATPSYPSAL